MSELHRSPTRMSILKRILPGESETDVMDDDDLDEEAGLSAMELTSGCGLEDLKAVVDSWIQFRY